MVDEKLKKEWENAAPNHRFVFAKLMQNEEICIGVLETFLQVKIDHIVYLKTEESVEEKFSSKGIRMDVYLHDEKGTVYNVEMQRENLNDLPMRSRYYQSLIDLNVMEKGSEYEKLCKSFVIFICNFDPFARGRSMYYFENSDIFEPDLKLQDGTAKLFFNTKGKDQAQIDPQLRLILEFFDGVMPKKKSDNVLLQKMADLFYEIKSNERNEVGFMTQAVYERDLKKLAYRHGYDSGYGTGYESAKSEYSSLLHNSEVQLRNSQTQLRNSQTQLRNSQTLLAAKDDQIAQLEAAIKVLSQQSAEK